MSSLPEVQEIIRWQVRPGDRLIAKLDRDSVISKEQAAELTARLRAALRLPEDFPIALTNSEWQFAVLSEPE